MGIGSKGKLGKYVKSIPNKRGVGSYVGKIVCVLPNSLYDILVDFTIHTDVPGDKLEFVKKEKKSG